MPEMHFWVYCFACGWQTPEPDSAPVQPCPQCKSADIRNVRFTNAEWHSMEKDLRAGVKTVKQIVIEENAPADNMPVRDETNEDEEALLNEKCFIEKKRSTDDPRFDVMTIILPNSSIRAEKADPEFKFTGERARIRFARLCVAQTSGVLNSMGVQPEVIGLLKQVFDMLRLQEMDPDGFRADVEQKVITDTKSSKATKH